MAVHNPLKKVGHFLGSIERGGCPLRFPWCIDYWRRKGPDCWDGLDLWKMSRKKFPTYPQIPCQSSWSRKHHCHFGGVEVYSWGMLQNFLEKPYECTHSIWENNKYMSKRSTQEVLYHPQMFIIPGFWVVFCRKEELICFEGPLSWKRLPQKMAPKLFQNHPTVMGEKLTSWSWGRFSNLKIWSLLDVVCLFWWTRRHLVFKQTTKNQPNYCRIAQIFLFRINQKTGWPKKARVNTMDFQRQTMRRNHLDAGWSILGLGTNLTANYMCSIYIIRQTLHPVGYTYNTSINLKGAGSLEGISGYKGQWITPSLKLTARPCKQAGPVLRKVVFQPSFYFPRATPPKFNIAP